MPPTTQEISELPGGVYYTLLEPCSVRVLRHVLSPDGHVWVVRHRPSPALLWRRQAVPLALGERLVTLPIRLLEYDFQLPTADFLGLLEAWPGDVGVTALQLDRPVPDSLDFRHVMELGRPYDVLRQNGWRLTFDLPFGGEYAEVTAAERGALERILADPVISAGREAGELP